MPFHFHLYAFVYQQITINPLIWLRLSYPLFFSTYHSWTYILLVAEWQTVVSCFLAVLFLPETKLYPHK